MIVLGLDQAPSGTGWALGDGSGRPQFGYKAFPDYGNNESKLIGYIIAWLLPFARRCGVSTIFSEQIVIDTKRHANVPVLMKQCAVVSAIATVCCDELKDPETGEVVFKGLAIPHYQAEIAAWRKRFIGLGMAPSGFEWKTEAIKACADRGWLIDRHDIAEACGVWDYGLAELDRVYRYGPSHTFVTRAAEKWRKLEQQKKAGAFFRKEPA